MVTVRLASEFIAGLSSGGPDLEKRILFSQRKGYLTSIGQYYSSKVDEMGNAEMYVVSTNHISLVITFCRPPEGLIKG